jgi:hypothetical protein
MGWIVLLLLAIWIVSLMCAAYYKGRADEMERK